MPIVNVTASATTSAASSLATAIQTVNAVVIQGGTFTADDGVALRQAAALLAENAMSVNGRRWWRAAAAPPTPSSWAGPHRS